MTNPQNNLLNPTNPIYQVYQTHSDFSFLRMFFPLSDFYETIMHALAEEKELTAMVLNQKVTPDPPNSGNMLFSTILYQ